MFTSSTKREIRHFYVAVVQWRRRNVQKSVMHVQSCAKPIVFAVLVAVALVVAYNKLPNVFTDNQSVKYNSPNLLHQDQDIKTWNFSVLESYQTKERKIDKGVVQKKLWFRVGVWRVSAISAFSLNLLIRTFASGTPHPWRTLDP